MIEITLKNNISKDDFINTFNKKLKDGNYSFEVDKDGDYPYVYENGFYDIDHDWIETGPQMKNKAWMTFIPDIEKLTFGFLGKRNKDTTIGEYAFFHCEFAKIIMTVTEDFIESIYISNFPVNNVDKLGNK